MTGRRHCPRDPLHLGLWGAGVGATEKAALERTKGVSRGELDVC